jgi:hypothetical protein
MMTPRHFQTPKNRQLPRKGTCRCDVLNRSFAVPGLDTINVAPNHPSPSPPQFHGARGASGNIRLSVKCGPTLGMVFNKKSNSMVSRQGRLIVVKSIGVRSGVARPITVAYGSNRGLQI